MEDNKDRSKLYECLIYAVFWLVVFVLPVLNEFFTDSEVQGFHWMNIIHWWIGMIPFILVFALHNFIILPKLFHTQRYRTYACVFILIMCLFGSYQKFQDDVKHRNMHRIERAHDSFLPPPPGPPVKRHAIQHRLPLPVLINLILLMFILGMNTAVFMSFRSHRDRQKMKLLENIRLQDELKYLKAQINPHFFMNVLNNIHAMMDVDTPKAQNMVIELSKLMRYVLYDGDSQKTTLISEMKFLSSYASLMRLRYSENKVKIKMDVPELIPNNS